MTRRILMMGVSGCGKSTVGQTLSESIGLPFRDADVFHSPGNVAKMRAGIPLADDDCWPWLDRVAETLHREAPVIVGCSALRRRCRDRIRDGAGGPVFIVHLTGDRDLINARMAARKGHYMPLSLLESQLAALEPPSEDEAMTVDIDQPLAAIVAQIAARPEGQGS